MELKWSSFVATMQTILNQILPTVLSVGEFQLAEQMRIAQSEILEKGRHQLVSFVDIESEKRLVQACSKAMPDSVFVAEENHSSLLNMAFERPIWIIDPLDGTTNYLHKMDVFSISVALVIDRKVQLGIVHCPALKRTYSALRGQGAYLNNKAIHCSNTQFLDESLIATGFPYYNFDKVEQYLELLKQFMEKTRGLRRLGSAAIDLAMVAAGNFDAFFEMNLSPWDVAAGALLVEEAGGKVADFKGGDNFIFGNEIVAGNLSLFAEIQQMVGNYLGNEI